MTRNNGKILLSHGAGGRLSHELIENVILKYLTNPILEKMDDSAEFTLPPDKIAFTTDSFVVHPLIFPGGDIGKLSVCGTVNDLAMKGAAPIALSLAMVIEEGFEIKMLERIVQSIQETSQKVGVNIVCGDTKVVEKGSADKIFITTSGIGVVLSKKEISGRNAKVGDAILLSGTIADHGISVLQARGNYDFQGDIQSDCAPLNDIVARLIDFCPEVHVLRDPTRGGLSTTLNEIARASQVKIEVEESQIKVNPSVQAACNLLGLDPLYVANEGKFVAFLPEEFAEKTLEFLRQHPLGAHATRIGQVSSGKPGVEIVTIIGGRRPLRLLEGEQLPRIC